jgi:SAM-dependent methyltransferase
MEDRKKPVGERGRAGASERGAMKMGGRKSKPGSNQPQGNIHYVSEDIARFYSRHRTRWDDFYPSEKWIFEQVAGPAKYIGSVMDAGCAAGGLGRALAERFLVTEYVGVDINPQAIEVARKDQNYPVAKHRFENGDFIAMENLPNQQFDVVFSLSCADWNIKTLDIIQSCWKYVKAGGHFVLTLRLTPEESVKDITESFQYVFFGDQLPENKAGLERAPYVVFNIREALRLLGDLKPKVAKITAYGYWGKPSPSAVTGFDRLVFTALAVRKGHEEDWGKDTDCELHLPVDLLY